MKRSTRFAALLLALVTLLSLSTTALAAQATIGADGKVTSENSSTGGVTVPSAAAAGSWVGTTKETVYLRKTAASSREDSNVYTKIAKGAQVTVTGESGSFYKVKYGSYEGYARKVDILGAAASAAASGTYTPSSSAWSGTTKEVVYLRKAADLSTKAENVLTKIPEGKTVTVHGVSGIFYYVEYGTNKGYARQVDIAGTPTALAESSAVTGAGSIQAEASSAVIWGDGRTEDASSSTPAAQALTPATNDPYTPVTNWTGSCKEKVYLRKAALKSTKSDNVHTTLSTGALVTVLGTQSGDGVNWYYVSSGSTYGYARQVDIKATSQSITDTSVASGDASSSTWGRVSVPGTVINYSVYNNSKSYQDYDHIYSLSGYGSSIGVIMGDNMRNRAGKSNSMFHELHHLQNKLLGVSTCERCKASCSGVGSSIDLTYCGKSNWSIVCFYETEVDEPAATLNYNALSSNLTGSDKQAWIDKQIAKAESSSKGKVLGSASATDSIVIFITCGDFKGSGTQARLYFVLKAS